MSKIPSLEEMLKLYTKKDLWERIQQHIQTIDQLKQQLVEKGREMNSLIADYEKRISQEQELMSNMEHRLTEKQNAIDEINKKFVQAVHDWKVLCVEKDNLIEFGKEEIRKRNKRIDEIVDRDKKLFDDKNKEIEDLSLQISELNSKITQMEEQDMIFHNQLAIQELEKTLNFIENVFDIALKNCSLNNGYYDQILDFIDQQIKLLKGEK